MHLAWAGGEGSASLLVTATGGALPPPASGRIAVVPATALAAPDAVVPMAGRWSTDGTTWRFTPRFPFAGSTVYALVRRDGAQRDGSRWTELARLARPAPRAVPTTSVRAIHPSSAQVPENLLRLSVTFSAPMDEGSAAGHVHLEDEAGTRIPGALLAMPPELWDRPRRRLTLLLDPGRTKRGLVPNVHLGPPLGRSERVTLVVGPGLRDANGAPLVAAARRSYLVGPALRARVDPTAWVFTWPSVGSQAPLLVRFDRPLDHALLQRCLRVVSPASGVVPGRASIGPGEVEWSFTPARRWEPSDLRLHIDADLEDLAGNSVRRVFDRDLRRPEDDPLDCVEIVMTPDGRVHPRA